ncbi:Hypothetical protein A7982_07361 [Minicystis rosea]|nr:Hypothetical protein A7982_07361 [Minicystis rosea]
MAAATALVSAAACGGGSESTGGAGGTGTGTTTGTSPTTTGTGGTNTGGSMGSGMLTSVAPAGTDAAFARAFDATMSNDGSIVYFTGIGPNGAGVFSVPAKGGTITPVVVGAPFVAPFGIAMSTDGKKLYVADPAATGSTLEEGRIVAVDPEMGTVSPLSGSDDILPRGLDVVAVDGADQLYFSGTKAGKAALFQMPASGGTPKEVASGALIDPEGVAATKNGKVYVLDARGSKTQRANVYVYDGSSLTEFITDVRVGYPAGIALSLDEKSLLISSLDATKGSSTLTIIDIFSKEPTFFPGDASLDKKLEPGGLHRARNAQAFAWVSYDEAGGSVLVAK